MVSDRETGENLAAEQKTSQIARVSASHVFPSGPIDRCAAVSLARLLDELKVPLLAGQGTRVVAIAMALEQSIILDGWPWGVLRISR